MLVANVCAVAPEIGVAAFHQLYVNPAGAVSVTLPPAQNVVGPLAVITGVAGAGFTVTVRGDDVPPQLTELVTLTV